MRTVYDIVHILPDKSERLVRTVDKMVDVRLFADTTEFLGTWVSETRKILRYRRGEIRIVERIPTESITLEDAIKEHQRLLEAEEVTTSKPTVMNHRIAEEDGVLKCIVRVSEAGVIHWLELSVFGIKALGLTKNLLWEVDSFTELGERIDKQVAYECLQLYEQHFAFFGARGTL